MSENKPRFKMKREPQPTAEEMVKLMRSVPYAVMSDKFQKTLYRIWAGQDKLHRK